MDKALELASHITHPGTIAVFVAVIAAGVLFGGLKSKKSRNPRIVLIILSAGIVGLGFLPLVASTIAQWRNIYHVRVIVLGPDHSPAENAYVSSSAGGEPKRVESGWEFDIPPQTRPADGRVVFYASVKSSFLSGNSTLVLANDYFPMVTIQLNSDASASLRGVVVDEHGAAVARAEVSIVGYSDVVVTNETGNFLLPAHAAEGQIVQVRAQKGPLVGSMSVPAGRSVELVIRKQ